MCESSKSSQQQQKNVTENGNQGDFSQKKFCSLVAQTKKIPFLFATLTAGAGPGI
jgi:hypothetical protein